MRNPRCRETNYIYSIYCAREHLDDDIILMHGDLVFENEVFDRVMASEVSCMTVSSTLPLPEKDFKAQVVDGKVMDGKKVYSINPKTIERYYMQNGQEAIDKYGEKAKDGVILITLKK